MILVGISLQNQRKRYNARKIRFGVKVTQHHLVVGLKVTQHHFVVEVKVRRQ